VHYYPLSRSIFQDPTLFELCAETDFLTVHRPPVFLRTSAVPVGWAAPLGRVFNEVPEIYVLIEMERKWEIPRLHNDFPEQRLKCIEELHDYYGEFINSIGCMTPNGDLGADPVVWDLTQ
jgi:hypothetical protein